MGRRRGTRGGAGGGAPGRPTRSSAFLALLQARLRRSQSVSTPSNREVPPRSPKVIGSRRRSPLYILASVQMDFKLRVAVETTATVAKCLTNLGLLLRPPGEVAPESVFAASQLAFPS